MCSIVKRLLAVTFFYKEFTWTQFIRLNDWIRSERIRANVRSSVSSGNSRVQVKLCWWINRDKSWSVIMKVLGMISLFRMVLKAAFEVLWKYWRCVQCWAPWLPYVALWRLESFALAMVLSFPLFSFPGQLYLTHSQPNLLAGCFW